jgi:hypothetical protein
MNCEVNERTEWRERNERMKSIIKAVFGLDEIGERERQARELEYKFSFSLVWISRERAKSGNA